MSPKFADWKELFEKKILKGKAIKIANRTIYPVIQISTLEIEGVFWFETITPIAIAVIEANNKYLLPLTPEESEEFKSYQSLKIEEILD